MNKVVNSLSLMGWAGLLAAVTAKLISDPANFNKADIENETLLLKAVQTVMLMDIVLILVGQSKGSILGSVAQITGRLVVALGYVSPQTQPLLFAIMTVIWAIADINRYLYYLVKNPLTTFLRYNSFLVLYPIGVFSEMRVINDYLKRNAAELSLEAIWFTRLVQFLIVVGMLFLYRFMLGMRAKQTRKPATAPSDKPKGKRE